VWNRVDCCTTRLNNFIVSADEHKCGEVAVAKRKNVVKCNNFKASSVTVSLKGKNYLTLCEVQVYGS